MIQAADRFRREPSPLLVVISGPSGVGKDSVVQRLQAREVPFYFVVTATDRPARSNEVHGRDYLFYTTAQFEQMIVAGELLEYAQVYGQYKGIPVAHVRQALASGQDVLLRVDVQGATTIKRLLPAAVTVFLSCQSDAELVTRLRARHTESEDALLERLSIAREEMAHMPEFDYIVVNPNGGLDNAVDDVAAIIRAEHCRALPRRTML